MGKSHKDIVYGWESQIPNTYEKRHSTLLVITGMKIKTTIRCIL